MKAQKISAKQQSASMTTINNEIFRKVSGRSKLCLSPLSTTSIYPAQNQHILPTLAQSPYMQLVKTTDRWFECLFSPLAQ